MSGIPRDDVDDLGWLLFRQDDVIARSQALAHMSGATLRHRLSSGRWQRPHRGILIAHNGPITHRQRLWIAALACGNGSPAPLGGLSALAELGMRGYASAVVHVLLPQRIVGAHPPPGVTVHRTSYLPRSDYHRGLPPRTSPARSVVDAASWAPNVDRARAIVAAAFQQRIVTIDEMAPVLARRVPIRRHGLIVETTRDAAGGAESISELDLLVLCRKGRLPEPTRQTVVIDASGRGRNWDASFDEWNVHIEVDGGQHMDVANWWADMQRQNDIWIDGDRILRFPAWALRHDPTRVTNQIRAALLAAGWSPKRS